MMMVEDVAVVEEHEDGDERRDEGKVKKKKGCLAPHLKDNENQSKSTKDKMKKKLLVVQLAEGEE